MLHLYLPGYSLKNKLEATNIVEKLTHNSQEVYLHEWLHWQDSSIEFDLETETEIVISEIKGIENFGIIAKSIGTLVALNVLSKLNLKAKYLILLGIPLNIAQKYPDLYLNLNMYSQKTYSIQNKRDEYGLRTEVSKFLSKQSFEEYTVDSDNHRYDYPELVWEIVSKSIQL